MKAIVIPTLLLVVLCSLTSFSVNINQDKKQWLAQAKSLLAAPGIEAITDAQEIPTEVIADVERLMLKTYKNTDDEGLRTFKLVSPDGLAPGGRSARRARPHYRMLNFAYNTGNKWIISYYHNEGRSSYQQVLIYVKKSKKKADLASLIIERRPSSPADLLTKIEQASPDSWTYPVADENAAQFIF